MATQAQKEAAIRVLMRAIHTVEAAQSRACVRACKVDQSPINEAKDKIYDVVRAVENGRT